MHAWAREAETERLPQFEIRPQVPVTTQGYQWWHGLGRVSPNHLGAGKLSLPLAWVAQESWPQWLGCWWADSTSLRLTHLEEGEGMPGQHRKAGLQTAGPTSCWCYWWESWSCPLSGQCGRTALGGKTLEGQPLRHGHGRAGPSSCRRRAGAGELAPPLAWVEGMLALVVWMRKIWLTNSTTTQAQIQDFGPL